MRSPKKLFISSTCFDLIDARAELKQALEAEGYVVYASETDDFPVNPELSAADNCLAVVRQTDIYLLIIHTRYGSQFNGKALVTVPEEFTSKLSVTAAEYFTARDAGLEIRIWVRDFIWTAGQVQTGTSKAQLSDTLPPSIDPTVFDFIDYLKNNPHEGGSWINPFHDIVDLKASVIHWLQQQAYRDESEFRIAVAEVCELLGYSFDRHLFQLRDNKYILARMQTSPFAELDAIWIIYEPAGRQVTWPLCQSLFLESFTHLSQSTYDRALFVFNTGYDANINAQLSQFQFSRRIRLITFDDLLDSLMPLGGYLERVVRDFECFEKFSSPDSGEDPIIDIMRRCDLHKFYVSIRGRCSPSDLSEYVMEWLHAQDRNQLTLLGDFGTGKSSFLLWLAYSLAKQYLRQPQKIMRMPLFVSLRDHAGKINVEEIIVNTLSNTYGIRNVSFGSFLKLLDAGRLVVLFDGFDETATMSNSSESLRILRELNSVVRRNAKVIISCRTQYFRTDQEANRDLRAGLRFKETELFLEQKGRTNFEIIYVQEFTPTQIEQFLHKHFEGDQQQTKRLLSKMHATYNLWDLAKRPVLLEMILKVYPRLSKSLGKQIITPAELYAAYINDWLAYVAKGNRDVLDQDAKKQFCADLAQWMYRHDREILPHTQLEVLVHSYFKEKPPAAYAALDVEVRTCSFLNRDTEGNYQFVHKSFMEYFIAKAMAEEVAAEQYDLFGLKSLSIEITNFMRGMLSGNDGYWKAIAWTKKKSRQQTKWVGANAIKMLRAANVDMRGGDFAGAVLSGADFSHVDLQKTSFVRADVADATFSGAQLLDADFSEAMMKNIFIKEHRQVTSLSWTSEYLVAGGEDCLVRLFSIASWQLAKTLQGHRYPVTASASSASEEFLFTLSDENLVAWALEGLERFAEFPKQSGEHGPLVVTFLPVGAEIRLHHNKGTLFMPSPLLSRSVEELELTVRTYNCLKNSNLHTIGNVIVANEAQLLKTKNFGRKSINELREILQSMGLDLGMKLQPGYSTNQIQGAFETVKVKDKVLVRSKEVPETVIFESAPIEDVITVTAYTHLHKMLAIGTSSGQVIVWDTLTGHEIANLAQGAFSCEGMMLRGAKGLEQPVNNESRQSLGEWLYARGAVIPQVQLEKLRSRPFNRFVRR